MRVKHSEVERSYGTPFPHSDNSAFHPSDQELAEYCTRWLAHPETVTEDQFYRIEIHLLCCGPCVTRAKMYEDRYRATLSTSVPKTPTAVNGFD